MSRPPRDVPFLKTFTVGISPPVQCVNQKEVIPRTFSYSSVGIIHGLLYRSPCIIVLKIVHGVSQQLKHNS